MKRIFIFLTTLVLAITTTICAVNAESFEYSEFKSDAELIGTAQKYIPEFDKLYSSNSSSYYLGSEIKIYLEEEGITKIMYESTSEVKFYPIYRDDEVIFTILDYQGGTKISSDYVNEINEMLKQSNDLALVLDGEKATFVPKSDVVMDTENVLERNNVIKTPIPYSSVKTVTAEEIVDVPFKAQSGDTTCWAACMASLIQFYIGGTRSWSTVCMDVFGRTNNIPTQDLTQMKNHFSEIYGISTGLNSNSPENNASAIRLMLKNGNAYILGWSTLYGGQSTSHATVLCGYRYSGGVYSYKIMDPQHTDFYFIEDDGDNSKFPDNKKIVGAVIPYDLVQTLSYDYVMK